MARAEWGSKRQCPSCGARFYDLDRNPIVCPKCDVTLEDEGQAKAERRRAQSPRAKSQAKSQAKSPPEPPPEPAVDKVDGEGESKENENLVAMADGEVPKDKADFIEDASELGEDEDDMAEVLEGAVADKEETR